MSTKSTTGDLTYIFGFLSAVLIVLNGLIDLIVIIFTSADSAIHRISFDVIAISGVVGIIVSLIAMFCGAAILSISERMRRTKKEHILNGIIIMFLSIIALIGGGGFLIGTIFGLIAGFIIFIR
ncbi:MAG: hypothetical protein ACYDAO_03515 [Thermoplasmataceae archaeon]